MSAVQGQPPQRVCPRCSTIARTIDAHCPFCGSSYRQRSPWGGVVLATLFATLAILAGVVVLGLGASSHIEREIDQQVDAVTRDVDRNVRELEERIDRKLDERLPQPGAGTTGG